mmetsp:Transcript_25714/g.60290  ORF Transcript_25714/g.60290 Transcript_25714/m.60290 type:complete len:266 (-) Transcript_25714:270-1067(-)
MTSFFASSPFGVSGMGSACKKVLAISTSVASVTSDSISSKGGSPYSSTMALLLEIVCFSRFSFDRIEAFTELVGSTLVSESKSSKGGSPTSSSASLLLIVVFFSTFSGDKTETLEELDTASLCSSAETGFFKLFFVGGSSSGTEAVSLFCDTLSASALVSFLSMITLSVRSVKGRVGSDGTVEDSDTVFVWFSVSIMGVVDSGFCFSVGFLINFLLALPAFACFSVINLEKGLLRVICRLGVLLALCEESLALSFAAEESSELLR